MSHQCPYPEWTWATHPSSGEDKVRELSEDRVMRGQGAEIYIFLKQVLSHDRVWLRLWWLCSLLIFCHSSEESSNEKTLSFLTTQGISHGPILSRVVVGYNPLWYSLSIQCDTMIEKNQCFYRCSITDAISTAVAWCQLQFAASGWEVIECFYLSPQKHM